MYAIINGELFHNTTLDSKAIYNKLYSLQCFNFSSISFSSDGQPTLLPPEHVQKLNLRSTAMLNAIQRFFAYHMIETYGCDYSTSGLSFDTLHSKLKSFLELRTSDGPRHDSYILYYSGHSHSSGEWALAGKY